MEQLSLQLGDVKKSVSYVTAAVTFVDNSFTLSADLLSNSLRINKNEFGMSEDYNAPERAGVDVSGDLGIHAHELYRGENERSTTSDDSGVPGRVSAGQARESERSRETENIPRRQSTADSGRDQQDNSGIVGDRFDYDRESGSASRTGNSVSGSSTHRGIDDFIPGNAGGLVTKMRANLAALVIVKQCEDEQREPTQDEKKILAGFTGFGAVALYAFPDPMTGQFRSKSWEQMGRQLQTLVSAEEYRSLKRTTFNAFYTSQEVTNGIFTALKSMGLPKQAKILEPGCGTGNFLHAAPEGVKKTGIEMDSLSGRIAKLLYPESDIRIENYRDTKLKNDSFDAVIGNVPFADIKMDYDGQNLALHDYFFAKSLDKVKPGGVMALVTSRYTMDKQNPKVRNYLNEKADFIGAIRLPGGAFKAEGTDVVTDVIFLQKKAIGKESQVRGEWATTSKVEINGHEVAMNDYFVNHPEMVIGDLTTGGAYRGDNLDVKMPADYHHKLREAFAQLPANIMQEAELATNEQIAEKIEPGEAVEVPQNLQEGSMFVAPSKAIMQVIEGEAEPVRHGKNALNGDTGTLGKRLAGLIALRDDARAVLRTQNEGLPEAQRIEARANLNRTYDAFIKKHSPINKTTISEDDKGSVRRTMPNLTKFRSDPDAFLVMSLEDYDETTGKATKATIMEKDVVGATREITQVQTAEEGLLAVLNESGVVNLDKIAELYGKPVDTVIGELRGLIFFDPSDETYVTADEYLSGNVRKKLEIANASDDSRCLGNAEALEEVQPKDLTPGDISVNLGAPWVPASDIQQFAAALFEMDISNIHISHSPLDAAWKVAASAGSLPATRTYGTDFKDGFKLLEAALNQKAPLVKLLNSDDTVNTKASSRETAKACQKQSLIKEAFNKWVFADHERADRLLEIYNKTYNNTRLRSFDGSHLTFPGLSQEINLRPHQKDAVWRNMSDGNTLLGHVVGAGKTFTMAAAGMKMKQTGLAQKPLYVVPNHMLEQFGREFMQLYPNAKLLVASKDDLKKDRRKLLTAKIATGDWDGVVVTHSSFERMGMSKDYQQQFMQAEVDKYDKFLREVRAEGDNHAGQRNLIKDIEKRKEARENKLKQLTQAEIKDDGLVFDELGIDQIFIDEAHYFKNLEFTTKMDRVAGVAMTGSNRAFDLYMKSQYLNDKHPGHGVTFATGTPVSNSMVEMYTMMRYLAPNLLKEAGVNHFDAWAATFGEVVDRMEIRPDSQGLRLNRRFAKFINLPELLQLFGQFADVQTADMLKLPTPKLKDGKTQIVSCPMNELQEAVQQELVERYEAIRSGEVKPWEDNALAITTDGRKLALDPRLLSAETLSKHCDNLSPKALESEDSKTKLLTDNVYQIWQDSADVKGTQMIFCDMGVNPSQIGYCAYDDVIDKLVEQGIPREQIAKVGDAATDAKKEALFKKVREGEVRVLLGSTTKMGTGTNVQKHLIALHHLDAPWKPAEVEQRNGRIQRQGNLNPEVQIFTYVTEGSFDAYMWQTLENKARFIKQVMTRSTTQRKAEDIGGEELSYAEVKAIATGNPAILRLSEMEMEVQQLSMLDSNFLDDQFRSRKQAKELPGYIRGLDDRKERYQADIAKRDSSENTLMIGSMQAPEGKKGAEALREAVKVAVAAKMDFRRPTVVGSYKGFDLAVRPGVKKHYELVIKGDMDYVIEFSRPTVELLPAIDSSLHDIDRRIGDVEYDKTQALKELEYVSTSGNKTFEHAEYLETVRQLRDELEILLAGENAEAKPAETDTADLDDDDEISQPTPDAAEKAEVALEAEKARRERMHELLAEYDALKETTAVEQTPTREPSEERIDTRKSERHAVTLDAPAETDEIEDVAVEPGQPEPSSTVEDIEHKLAAAIKEDDELSKLESPRNAAALTEPGLTLDVPAETERAEIEIKAEGEAPVSVSAQAKPATAPEQPSTRVTPKPNLYAQMKGKTAEPPLGGLDFGDETQSATVVPISSANKAKKSTSRPTNRVQPAQADLLHLMQPEPRQQKPAPLTSDRKREPFRATGTGQQSSLF